MTPALLLWTSWMYVLLGGNLGFQIARDGLFRPPLSDQNLGEANDLDLKFDEGEGESSANQQSSYIYTGLYTPPGAPSPNFNVDFGQNVPNSIWQPSVQYPPVNAESPSSAQSGTVVWVVQGNEVGQPAVQHPPVNAESPSSAPSGTAVWYVQDNQVGQPSVQYSPQSSAVSPGQGNEIWQPPFQYPPAGSKPLGTPSSNVMWSETNEIEKPPIQYPPVNAKPPGSALSGPAVWSVQDQARQPAVQYPPVNAGPQMPPVAALSGPAVWSAQDQVRQPAVQYPPVNAGPSVAALSGPAVWSAQDQVRQPAVQYPPVNAGPQMPPVAFVQGNELDRSTRYASPLSKLSPQRSKGWLDFVFSKSFGDEDFDNMDFEPLNSVTDMETETIWGPVIAEEPLPLPQKPKPYIVHSKNGYKRGRVVHTKTFYSDDHKKPKIIEKVKSAKQKF